MSADFEQQTTARIGKRIAALRKVTQAVKLDAPDGEGVTYAETGGMTAADLSQVISELGGNLSRGTIAKIEVGLREISVNEMLLIAQALAVPPWQLFIDLEEPEKQQWLQNQSATHPYEMLRWWRGDVGIEYPGRDILVQLDIAATARTRVMYNIRRFEARIGELSKRVTEGIDIGQSLEWLKDDLMHLGVEIMEFTNTYHEEIALLDWGVTKYAREWQALTDSYHKLVIQNAF